MERSLHYLGIDVAKATITLSVLEADCTVRAEALTVPNTPDGFAQALASSTDLGCTATNTTVCVEATGAYSLPVSMFFTEHGWPVAVLHALAVQRAFQAHRHKTDPADSRIIAEYGARYPDRLIRFVPRLPAITHMQILLQTRDQYIRERTAMTNRLEILTEHGMAPTEEQQRLRDSITHRSEEIQRCDQDLRALVRHHPALEESWRLMLSVPGVGPMTAATLLVVTNGATCRLEARTLAAYCGIAPLQRQSGTSLNAPARTRGFGPQLLRRQLYLASLAMVRENKPYHGYYLRKQAEGKKKILILNNVANKALRVICAMLRDRVPYSPTHRSVHPQLAS